MKIVIGNDHAGTDMKNEIVNYLKNKGHEIIDVGTNDTVSCDYPAFAEKAAIKVLDKEARLGILICGTGVGLSIAANKIPGIRACCCSDEFSAKMSRQHNNANMLTFGAKVVNLKTAFLLVDAFLGSEFEGERHQRRVDMIADLERKYH